jgi:hypothetical protein
MPTIQIQAQLSFDDLLSAVEQLNPFEWEQLVSKTQQKWRQVSQLPRRESLKKVNQPLEIQPSDEKISNQLVKTSITELRETQSTPENHPLYQLLIHIITHSVPLTPYVPYIKDIFRAVSDTDAVIPLSLAIEAISIIVLLPDIDKYHLSIDVLEDSGLVLEFVLEPARVTCVLREQYAHIIWMQNDEITHDVLQGTDFSIQKTSQHLQQVFETVSDKA